MMTQGKRENCVIEVDTWEQFEDELKKSSNISTQNNVSTTGNEYPLLYRGQSNSDWPLFTTLERELQALSNITFSDYYRKIFRIKPNIESFTNNYWPIRNPDKYMKLAKEKDLSLMLIGINNHIEELSYMIYLRHHGFPSPLLDWSRSSFIAAYFAFYNISKIPTDSRPERVSIYVYRDLQNAHSHGFETPYIHTFGPHVRTHQRHFLQQSQYTMCFAYSQQPDEWLYTHHEAAIYRAQNHQDILRHYTIPSSEWRKVISMLDSININGFSLFGSEESLMQTMSFREMHN